MTAIPLSAGVIRLLVGRGFSLALSFLAWAFLARALGPTSFGFLQFAIAVVFYLSFLTDFGLTTLGTRELAAGTDRLRLVRQLLGLRLALAAVGLAVGVVGMFVLTDSAATRWVWVILLTTIPASALNAVWVLRALGKSMALAVIDVVGATTLFAGAFLIWLLYRDAILAALVYGLGQWLAAVASMLSVGNLDWFKPSATNAFRYLRQALPLAVAVLAINVYYSADSVLLGLMRTKAEVGYYAAAYKLVLPWLMVASIVGHLAMPVLARLQTDAPDRLAASLRRLSAPLLAFGLSTAVGVTLLAPVLISVIFGSTYAPAAAPLAILIWSCVTVFGNAPFGFLMLARRQDRAYMWAAIIGAVINLALNVVLIPTAGMIGAAVATIAAEVAVFLMIIWWTRDIAPRILSHSVVRAAFVAATVGIAVWPTAGSVWAVPVGAAAFMAAALLSGVVSLRQVRSVARVALPGS